MCHLAGVFVDKLKTKMERYKKSIKEKNDQEIFEKDVCMDPYEEQCIRIAALCHDLGRRKKQ